MRLVAIADSASRMRAYILTWMLSILEIQVSIDRFGCAIQVVEPCTNGFTMVSWSKDCGFARQNVIVQRLLCRFNRLFFVKLRFHYCPFYFYTHILRNTFKYNGSYQVSNMIRRPADPQGSFTVVFGQDRLSCLPLLSQGSSFTIIKWADRIKSTK